jgi:hypothetical protein
MREITGAMRKLWLLILVAGGISLRDGTAAVVTPCDEAGLRAAIAEGGVVTFGCSGTITLTQAITITTNVVLNGVGAQVTLSGGDKTRLFNVSPGVVFELQSLRLTRGIATHGGAISNDGGQLVLTGVTVVSNNATPMGLVVGPGAGGAIYSRSGMVVATQCVFASNSVYAASGFAGPTPARGGAIAMDGGSLQVINCVFESNAARGGPGRGDLFPGVANPGTDALGGAIFSSGTTSVQRCQFFRNQGTGGDGTAAMSVGGSTSGSSGGSVSGGSIYNSGTLKIEECTFAGNLAAGGLGGSGTVGTGPGGSGGTGGAAGGAVIYNLGSLAVWGSTFATNTGRGGTGGGAGSSSSLAAMGGNGGSGGSAFGAAIFSTNVTTYITNCTLVGNVLRGGDGRSGGVGGSCIASGCTTGGAGGAGGNGGNAAGAGLYLEGGSAAIVHCTFDNNFVGGGTNGLGGPGGGGRTGSGPAGLPGAPAVTVGGALTVVGGSVQAANSIFARSQGSTNCAGRLVDLGINISSDNSVCFTNPASMRNQDAGLAELADNGGPTPTIALLPTSAALNGGNDAFAPRTDQRRVLRPQGKRCDVGAFEAGYLRIAIGVTNVWLSYGSPPGTVCRLEGQANGGTWRDLGTTTADVRGFAHYGPVAMTNTLEIFRARSP